MLSHVILGLLRDGDLHHGYELITEYRARSGVPASTGSFYRELARLEACGWVETGTNPTDTDARRIPYRITEKGCGAFHRWLLAPPRNDGEMGGWLLFLGHVPAAARERLLDGWQEQLWLRSQALTRQHRVALESTRAAGASTDYAPLCTLLSRQMRHVAAELAFLDDIRADIKTYLTPRDEGQQTGDAVLAPRQTTTARPPSQRRRNS